MRLSSGRLVCLLLGCACVCAARGERTIDADAYFDKLHGMWLGQLIGNMAGRPTEGVYSYGSPNPAESVPWVLLDEWGADDDTDLEYLIQHVYLTHGLDPTPQQLRDEWVAHVPYNGIYVGNRQARYLMDAGFLPPVTGSYQHNVCWNTIDGQITTESIGSISPGLRQWAVDHAGTWARITGEGFPVHAAQFYVAMYAAAVFESDVPTLIQLGLEAIPQTSRTASVINDVIAWHQQDLLDGEPDWRATRQLLYDHYQGGYAHGRYIYWIESTINVGATTLALLYGEGDFEQTVQIAILAGWDCDCNPATAGGLLGVAYGHSGLPSALTSQCGDVYRNDYRPDLPLPGPPPQYDSIIAICQQWQTLAEQVIVGNGGWITDDGGQRVYHIPADDPVTPEPEFPDPPGAGGIVGELRSQGEDVTISASVEHHSPSHDRYDLARIADGMKDPRYNGHRPYWTIDGDPTQPPGGDYYQFAFPRMVRVDRVIFWEGDLYPVHWNDNPFTAQRDGGFFLNLTVEVLRCGEWFVPPGLVQSEPLDRYVPHQSISFDMPPQWCDAVRIRGDAGGDLQFTTILELEACGFVAAPAIKGDLTGDGHVTFDDINPFVLALTDPDAYVQCYPEINPYDAADVNDDGAVDFDDINPFVDRIGT